MTAQDYFNQYQGQSLLYAPSAAREWLRGQCVQSVCFYVANNGAPVLWVDGAIDWWNAAAAHPDKYERIPNTPEAVPQPGDIIIWNGSLPGSGDSTHDPAKGQGYGHIDVCLQPLPGTGTFIGVDQNWGGKTIHKVTHNYNYVIGWLRIKSAAPAPAPQPAPAAQAPAPAPTSGGIEMIANETQAHQAYQLLRPNGDGNADEIAGTAGRRSWAQFASDAQGEVAARNAALRDQVTQLGNMQGTINSQNATITELTSKLNDATVSNSDKQKALTEALAKIADDNANLATSHDQIVDLNDKVNGYENNPVVKAQNAAADLAKKPSQLGKLLASILASVAKFKLGAAKKKS